MQTFVNLDDMLGYFAQFVLGKVSCISVSIGSLRSAFMANCCNLVIDIPNLCVNR